MENVNVSSSPASAGGVVPCTQNLDPFEMAGEVIDDGDNEAGEPVHKPVAGFFEVMRDAQNPYVGAKAEEQELKARQRLPREYAEMALEGVGENSGTIPRHNLLCLGYAHAYADCGLRAIDAHTLKGNGKPTGTGGNCKNPIGAAWGSEATTDHDKLNDRWRGRGEYPPNKNGVIHPYARLNAMRNVAVVMDDWYFVLDLDGEDGIGWLEEQEAKHGKLPKTVTARSGSGGQHTYLKCPNRSIRNTASEIAPNVDIRGKGGQALVPPSMHKSGSRYEWVEGCAPWECEIADAPEWLEDAAHFASKSNRAGSTAKSTKRKGSKKRASSAKSKTEARGLDVYLAEIGDGDGQRNFNAPIWQAFCSYYATEGADAPAAPILKQVREAVEAAERDPDRDRAKYDNDEYLAEQAKKAQEFIAEAEKAPFDITAPLGDTMAEALASLDRGFRYVNIGGEGRFVRHLVPGEPPKLEVWNNKSLSDWYANRKVPVTTYDKDGEEAGEEETNAVPVFFNLAERWAGTAFAPPPAVIGENTYNLFRGFTVEPEPGDCTMLKDFILHVICDGDEDDFKWLWHWMAHLVQRPGEKPKTAVVIWGEGGIGKGHFGRILRALVHPYGTTLGDKDSVVGRWAGEIHALNLVCVSEEAVFSGNREVANALKHKIDHEKVRVEVKHIQPIELESFTRYVFDSNHPDAVIIEGNGSERRFFVRRVSKARKGDTDYFEQLRAEIDGDGLSALFHELMNYDPTDVGMEWRDVFMAPETHDRKLMEHETMRPVYRAFDKMIKDGEFEISEGLEKYRFVFAEGHTIIPKRMLDAFVAHHGDSRQAAESDPIRVYQRLYDKSLPARRVRAKCYYRRANEDDADVWVEKELNLMSYDLQVNRLTAPTDE